MLVFTNTNHSYSDNTIKHNVLKYCNNTFVKCARNKKYIFYKNFRWLNKSYQLLIKVMFRWSELRAVKSEYTIFNFFL